MKAIIITVQWHHWFRTCLYRDIAVPRLPDILQPILVNSCICNVRDVTVRKRHGDSRSKILESFSW